MDETNYPMFKPIPLEEINKFSHKMDWSEIYGRYGTSTHIWPNYYHGEDKVPPHLDGKVTHVYLYWEE